MLSANRFLEYWNQLQGVITAEGDNQLMLLKVGRQLFDEGGLAPPSSASEPTDSAFFSPERAVALFTLREERLLEELRAGLSASRRRTRDLFSIWNENVNRTISLATAYGVRVTAESFSSAVRDCGDSNSVGMLGTLFSLWALEQIERHSGWFSSEGCLTREWFQDAPRAREALYAEIEANLDVLTHALGFDNSVLQAPIAEDDYVVAYHSHFQHRASPWDEDGADAGAQTEPSSAIASASRPGRSCGESSG